MLSDIQPRAQVQLVWWAPAVDIIRPHLQPTDPSESNTSQAGRSNSSGRRLLLTRYVPTCSQRTAHKLPKSLSGGSRPLTLYI